MTREQRFRLQTFVRVRDFGIGNVDLFPESSAGGEAFAQVATVVSMIEQHLADRIVARAEARRVKSTTRAAVFDAMKAVALAARRVTRTEPGESPFRMPRRRSLQVELSTAKVFITEAEQRQDQFARFGLPPAFLDEFRTQVGQLQQVVDIRLSSKTARHRAQAGIETQIARGLEIIRDLGAIVTIATRQDPVRFAAWRAARRIEGQGAGTAPKVTPLVVEPTVATATSEKPAPEPPKAVDAADDVIGRAS